MPNFEDYIFDSSESPAASLTDDDVEIIRDLHEEDCLAEVALAEAALLRQTQPNLFIVSECLAAYQRIGSGSKEAEMASRIGSGIGAIVAAETGYGLGGRHNLDDISVRDRDSFYEADWWPLEFLLQSVDARYSDALYPMHEAMDYHLDFDGLPAESHRAARLGATVCFAIAAHRRLEIEAKIDQFWLDRTSKSEARRFIESRNAVVMLDATRQYLA
jgi:hypothetical protein